MSPNHLAAYLVLLTMDVVWAACVPAPTTMPAATATTASTLTAAPVPPFPEPSNTATATATAAPPSPTAAATPTAQPTKPLIAVPAQSPTQAPKPTPTTLTAAEIQQQIHDLSIKLTTGPYAAVPKDLDPQRRAIVGAAIEQALIMAPYGVSAEQLNQFILAKTGRDFRKYINDTYGKYGIDYDRAIADLGLNGPNDVFERITIDPYHFCAGAFTCWVADSDTIYLSPMCFDKPSYLAVGLFKEAVANRVSDNASALRLGKIQEARAQGKPPPSSSTLIGGYAQISYGESISFALEAYLLQHCMETDHTLAPGSDSVSRDLDYAFAGGVSGILP